MVSDLLYVLLSANAETVITADQAVRGGKLIGLQQVVHDAVTQCPCVKRVFVTQRTGADVPRGQFDIPLDTVAKKSIALVYTFF